MEVLATIARIVLQGGKDAFERDCATHASRSDDVRPLSERCVGIRPRRDRFLLDSCYIVVGANTSIGDHIAPVDKLLRLHLSEIAESGGQTGKIAGCCRAARKGARRGNFGWISVNAPIRS